jgi:hypothetical protein
LKQPGIFHGIKLNESKKKQHRNLIFISKNNLSNNKNKKATSIDIEKIKELHFSCDQTQGPGSSVKTAKALMPSIP